MGVSLKPGRAADPGEVMRRAGRLLAATTSLALFFVGSQALGDARAAAAGAGDQTAPSTALEPRDLRVNIEGIRSGFGTVMIGLYDNADGFIAAIKNSAEMGLLNDKGRLAGIALRATSGTRSVVFMQLPPGQYALIVFHDENDNGRLDENAWGVPTEGYGFSNNAQGLLGAPSFDAAKITLDGTSSVPIRLIYPRALSTSDLSELSD